jgi:hypothetical protein
LSPIKQKSRMLAPASPMYAYGSLLACLIAHF